MADLTLDERGAAAAAALTRRDWPAAARLFAEVLDRSETAEALEGYAAACWWLDEAAATIEARGRAYGRYRARGDRLGAARIATALAGDFVKFRGQPAVAEGWLRRARRLLAEVEPSAEHAWLATREAETALFHRGDPRAALTLAVEATATADRLGLVDVEVVALAMRGLALVEAGRVGEGVGLLDKAGAAISAGELSALEWIGSTYCCFIYAFERVRDP